MTGLQSQALRLLTKSGVDSLSKKGKKKQKMASPPPSLPPLCAPLHISFISSLDALRDTRLEYVASEHLRASATYWGLCALEVLGAPPSAMPKPEVLALVQRCARPCGGYAGAEGHDPHLLHTLSALQLLALCGALPRGEAAAPTIAYLRSLQRPDGSFAGDAWGEVDTRFTYCALQAAALLGALDSLDVPSAVAFVRKCRNFDGGFGAVPGGESHAGQVFCCVGALAIAGALEEVLGSLRKSVAAHAGFGGSMYAEEE